MNNMSVSIMEALQNANHNLGNLQKMPMLLPLIEKYGSVENVPEKEDSDNA
jgi:hypothetical protein